MKLVAWAFPLAASSCFLIAGEEAPTGTATPTHSLDAGARVDAPPEANVPEVAVVTPALDASVVVDGTASACAALGGTCVLGRWAHCPPGTQPAADIHAGCGEPRGNFCCVPLSDAATAKSACAMSASGMRDCFPTADCHPCFLTVSDPAATCDQGRTCCEYACPD